MKHLLILMAIIPTLSCNAGIVQCQWRENIWEILINNNETMTYYLYHTNGTGTYIWSVSPAGACKIVEYGSINIVFHCDGAHTGYLLQRSPPGTTVTGNCGTCNNPPIFKQPNNNEWAVTYDETLNFNELGVGEEIQLPLRLFYDRWGGSGSPHVQIKPSGSGLPSEIDVLINNVPMDGPSKTAVLQKDNVVTIRAKHTGQVHAAYEVTLTCP